MYITQDEPLTAGFLAGDGLCMVHLCINSTPCPEEVPDDLAEHVEAVRDEKGKIRDWRFHATPFQPGQPATNELTRFRRWRAAYITDRVMADRATVTLGLAWAARHLDISALQVLRLPKAHWELGSAIRAEEQARRASSLCRTTREHALGIVAQADATHDHARILRGFVAEDQPLLLLVTPKASVLATGDALLLSEGGPTYTVHGWHLEGDSITARTDEGPVELGDSPGAHLLEHLAPGVGDVIVNHVPVASVFGLMFMTLAEMAHEATTKHAPLRAHIGGK